MMVTVTPFIMTLVPDSIQVSYSMSVMVEGKSIFSGGMAVTPASSDPDHRSTTSSTDTSNISPSLRVMTNMFYQEIFCY